MERSLKISAEYIRDHYVGIPLQGYRGYVFGLELVSRVWDELVKLGEQEWEEVGDNERLGLFNPDRATSLAHERRGNMAVFTVREIATSELVGYFVGTVGTTLKMTGVKTFSEVGVYLRPDARAGRLFNYFLAYVEQGVRHLGCAALIVSHRPEHSRIGKFYQRAGFTPLSHDYYKRVDQ